MKLNNIQWRFLANRSFSFEIYPKVVGNICEHLMVLYVILIGDVYVGLQTVGTDTVDLREKHLKDMDLTLST